jgi:ribosome production factor 2
MAPTEQQLRQKKAAQLSGKHKVSKARVQRYITNVTQSQIKELGPKSVLLLKGRKTSIYMNKLLIELRSLQAPASKLLNKKNMIDIFTSNNTGTTTGVSSGGANTGGDGSVQSLEFLMTKNDCNLFGIATHNKKRPNNLIIGRTFNCQLLDNVELGILYYKSAILNSNNISISNGSKNDSEKLDIPKKRIGSKPLLLFNGDIWNNIPDYSNLRNLLIDFYRGDVVDKLVVTGLDHIIVFTASYTNTLNNNINTSGNNTVLIHQRTYHVQLKKNTNTNEMNGSTSIPVAHLTSTGPDLDFIIRRTIWAQTDLAIAARVQPKASSKNKKSATSLKGSKKNQSTNVFGETLGRLHIEKQNLDKMSHRKVKALRRAEKTEQLEEKNAIEEDLNNELIE